MTLRKIAAHAAMAALAVTFVLGTTGLSEAAKKKKAHLGNLWVTEI